MIKLNILKSGEMQTIEVPNDMGLNLMELLKGEAYETIEGTCGGMALCATCHIKIASAEPVLSEPSNDEIDMLETLPVVNENSRLGCQVRLDERIKRLTIEIIEN